MDSKVTMVAMAVLAGGCATTQLPPIKASEEVAIVAAGTTHTAFDFYNNAMGQAAGSGSKGGVVVGALWGLSCGPWFLVCMPMGALFGSGMGALGGTAVGALQGPEAETKERLMNSLRAYAQARNAEADLADSIAAMAGGRSTLMRDASPVSVVARIDQVALHARRGDRIVLGLKATVTVRRSIAAASGEPDSKMFQYLGPEADVRLWLENRGDFVSESLQQAIRHIAREAFSELSR